MSNDTFWYDTEMSVELYPRNLTELKGWVGGAKKKLDQILTIDISPEDRARLTRELQADVKGRMEQLERLERDAEVLLGSAPAAGCDRGAMAGLQEEVESVKVKHRTRGSFFVDGLQPFGGG